MTTEDDFQAALDANPNDYQTRLVFSDWLQERDDPRWEGYKAMGLWRLRPEWWHYAKHWYWFCHYAGTPYSGHISWWWHNRLVNHKYETRREAEDAAARAFATGTEGKKQGLLRKEVPCG